MCEGAGEKPPGFNKTEIAAAASKHHHMNSKFGKNFRIPTAADLVVDTDLRQSIGSWQSSSNAQ